jgi:DNA-directed RNA polymerase specialized sigma24 family protein
MERLEVPGGVGGGGGGGPRDEAGQNALSVEIHRLAHIMAWVIVGRRSYTEDVAQDVVSHCLTRIREGTWRLGSRALDAHIACLVRRRAVVYRRRWRRRDARHMAYLRELEGGVRAWMEPGARMVSAQLRAVCAATLETLPRVWQETFELVRGENLSYTAAAKRLGVKPSTVKARVLRTQGAFREALSAEGIEVEKGRRPKVRDRPRRRRRAAARV